MTIIIIIQIIMLHWTLIIQKKEKKKLFEYINLYDPHNNNTIHALAQCHNNYGSWYNNIKLVAVHVKLMAWYCVCVAHSSLL